MITHVHLDESIRRLLLRVHAGDAADVVALWREVEREIREHMDAEETDMLPRFAEVYPAEAAWVLEDHRRIRALLDEIGYGIELHVVREPTIRALAERLRSHAEREEAGFYRFDEHGAEAPLGRASP